MIRVGGKGTIEATHWLLGGLTHELTLVAALALLAGGLDDLAVDAVWIGRSMWRRLAIYSRHPRASAASLAPPEAPGRMAIFIPAWQEAEVIGDTLDRALRAIRHADYRIYVGTYPNDPATIAAVRAVADPRVRLVCGTRAGPTTKAECLNRLWQALRRDEDHSGVPYKAVVLHDAEDRVHPCELALFDRLIERFDFIQIPVFPLATRSRFVSGHYIDEFIDGHTRQLVVREALGASLPAAGVGCAFSRAALAWSARRAGGLPFDEHSLTEDYEAGLRLAAFPGRKVFVAIPAERGGAPVAVHAEFPDRFWAAVRQKTRWKIGIALAGWDRIGWQGSLAERWMLLRDRRGIVAPLVVALAYLALLLNWECHQIGVAQPWLDRLRPLLLVNLWLLGWRLALRYLTVGWYYGSGQAFLSVPRVLWANAIDLISAIRALRIYRPGTTPRWDKTVHHAPASRLCD